MGEGRCGKEDEKWAVSVDTKDLQPEKHNSVQNIWTDQPIEGAVISKKKNLNFLPTIKLKNATKVKSVSSVHQKEIVVDLKIALIFPGRRGEMKPGNSHTLPEK